MSKKRVYDENGNVTHKVCSKCGELKDINEFSVDKKVSDGHQRKCKECDKKYKEEYKKREKRNATEKVCSTCGKLKGIDEFYASKRESDGHQSRCKECEKKYNEERKKQTKRNVTEKVCNICGKLKGIDEFSVDKSKSDGHQSQCKECVKKYKEENKEQIKEQKKKWYEELCDETITRIKTIVEQDPTRYDYKVGEEIYGVIYLVCCKPTNKYYVGQTTIGFDNRYSGGFFSNSRNRTKDDLMEDLERYGEDSFEITEIFKVAHNKEELDDLEVYYIDYFNSYYNGYNETRGNHHAK